MDTYRQEGEGFVKNVECMIDAPIEPCMISTGAECDEVLLVLDIIHLGSVERLVGLEVIANTAVLRFGRTIGRKHLLTRVENDGYSLRSALAPFLLRQARYRKSGKHARSPSAELLLEQSRQV